MLWTIAVFFGAGPQPDFAWLLANICNALTAFPRLLWLLLSPVIVGMTCEYFAAGGAEEYDLRSPRHPLAR